MTNTNSYSAKSWFYNHDTEAFKNGPDLLEGRYFHGSATVVDKVTKAKIVVVTGGYNNDYLDSTEMLINGQWKIGTMYLICTESKNLLICCVVILPCNDPVKITGY